MIKKHEDKIIGALMAAHELGWIAGVSFNLWKRFLYI